MIEGEERKKDYESPLGLTCPALQSVQFYLYTLFSWEAAFVSHLEPIWAELGQSNDFPHWHSSS